MQGYAAREHPALGVMDPLFGRVMVLESGGERVALVGTDLVGIDAELAQSVRETAERECGIPGEAIMVGGSHTHWGPALRPPGYVPDELEHAVRPEYVEELALRLGMAIVMAERRREPARVGVGCGWNPLISFNRRPLDDAGQCQMNLRAPEDVAKWAAAEGARQAAQALGVEGVGPTPLQPPSERPESDLGRLRWGPTDPQAPIIRVEGEEGTLGGVVSFACHPVCGAGDETFYDISADYPGAMQRMLERNLRRPAVFTLGCAGNQVPIQRGPGTRERVGHSLAAEALRVWESIELRDEVCLAANRVEFDLPIKDFASMEAPEGEDSHARYVRHLIEKHAGRTHVPAEVQALRIGDMGLISLPGEIFAEIGHEIKRRSPFGCTMPVSVANGCDGYIAPQEAYEQGGYEVGWNIASPEAAEVLIEAAMRALEGVAC